MDSTTIFANPALADECFAECSDVNYGKFFGKLAEKCGPLRQRFENGERIRQIECEQMKGANGATSRVFRCKVFLSLKNEGIDPISNDASSPFSFILKVFSLDHASKLAIKFMGEENLMEMLKKITKIRMAKEQGDGENAEERELTMNEHFHLNHEYYTRLHHNECNLYEFINGDGKQQSPVPIPEIYFCQPDRILDKNVEEPGLIAMEDLQNTKMVELADGLNRQQMMVLATMMANLHAHAMDPGVGDWRRLFKTHDEFFPRDENQAVREKLLEASKEYQKNEQFAASVKRLGRLFDEMGYGEWAQKKVENELGIPEALNHGDMWINNILWQNKDPNKLAALIDWQLTTKGNPMDDLARMMAMNVKPEVRHELEKDNRIFAHYLEKLNANLEEKGMEPVKYGIQELKMAYNLAMAGHSSNCILVVSSLMHRLMGDAPNREQQKARISRRIEMALADIVERMEEMAPEWLLPIDDDEDKIKEKEGK